MSGSSRGIAGVAVATVLIALAYGASFFSRASSIGLWLMVVGVVLLSISTVALSPPPTQRGQRLLHIALACSGMCLFFGLGAPLLLGYDVRPAESSVWGLPARAAWVVLVAGILPLVIMPVAFAFAWTSRD